MNNFYVFWSTLNGLEFITYVLIPSAMLLIILVYIYFNARLIRLSIELNQEWFNKIYDKMDNDLQKMEDKIAKIDNQIDNKIESWFEKLMYDSKKSKKKKTK
jgi:hypothetical protein